MYSVTVEWAEAAINESELLSVGATNVEVVEQGFNGWPTKLCITFEFYDVMLAFLVHFCDGNVEEALALANTAIVAQR